MSNKQQLWKMIKEGSDRIEMDFYSYSFYLASLANGVSGTDTINIQANSAFVVVKSTVFADIAGAAQTEATRVIPLLTVSITDSGSGRNLQNAAVPIASIAGDGKLPFVWPRQRLFEPSSAVSAVFTNYSNATTYANIYLTLIGFQVFEY